MNEPGGLVSPTDPRHSAGFDRMPPYRKGWKAVIVRRQPCLDGFDTFRRRQVGRLTQDQLGDADRPSTEAILELEAHRVECCFRRQGSIRPTLRVRRRGRERLPAHTALHRHLAGERGLDSDVSGFEAALPYDLDLVRCDGLFEIDLEPLRQLPLGRIPGNPIREQTPVAAVLWLSDADGVSRQTS